MRIILQGSSRGQHSQAVIWLVVGVYQKPGGPANGKCGWRLGVPGNHVQQLSIHPGRPLCPGGIPSVILLSPLTGKDSCLDYYKEGRWAWRQNANQHPTHAKPLKRTLGPNRLSFTLISLHSLWKQQLYGTSDILKPIHSGHSRISGP